MENKVITLQTNFGVIEIELLADNTGGFLTSHILEPGEELPELDGIESLILAHALAGVDVTSPHYIEGVNTALDAIDNQG